MQELLLMTKRSITDDGHGYGFAPAAEAAKDDGGKLDLSLLPPSALCDIARVMQYGASRYGRSNWTRGCSWTRYYSACMRHVFAWLAGEDRDLESGLPHLAHAAASLMILLEYARSCRGNDNRNALDYAQPDVELRDVS